MNQFNKKKRSLDNYARYSSMAIQMLAIIVGGVFLGVKLDEWLGMTFPVFAVIFSFISVALAIYFAVKDLIRFGKKNKNPENNQDKDHA